MKDSNPNSRFSHIALLVPSAARAAVPFQPYFPVAPPQVWEGEGTLEIYVGDLPTQMGTLLLMEAVREGAYQRALAKRGPGVHHIALDVLNLEKFMGEIAGSGWFLHTQSLKTQRHSKTVYLCRPGMPTLIEVQEREVLIDDPLLVEEIQLPGVGPRELAMFEALGLTNIISGEEVAITLQGQKFFLKDLVS